MCNKFSVLQFLKKKTKLRLTTKAPIYVNTDFQDPNFQDPKGCPLSYPEAGVLNLFQTLPLKKFLLYPLLPIFM